MRSVSSESYFALNAGYVESGVKRIQLVTLCQERTLTKLKAFVNGSLSSCTNSVSKSSASTFPTRVMRGSGGGAEAISARIRDMSCWALFHAFCQDAARESGWAEDMGSRGHGAGRGRRDRDVLDVHSRAPSDAIIMGASRVKLISISPRRFSHLLSAPPLCFDSAVFALLATHAKSCRI